MRAESTPTCPLSMPSWPRLTRRAPNTRYDTADATRLIGGSAYPDRVSWAAEYVRQHYSDSEAPEAFIQIARDQATGP